MQTNRPLAPRPFAWLSKLEERHGNTVAKVCFNNAKVCCTVARVFWTVAKVQYTVAMVDNTVAKVVC